MTSINKTTLTKRINKAIDEINHTVKFKGRDAWYTDGFLAALRYVRDELITGVKKWQ